jgi:hypothetical protein
MILKLERSEDFRRESVSLFFNHLEGTYIPWLMAPSSCHSILFLLSWYLLLLPPSYKNSYVYIGSLWIYTG